MNSSSVKGAWKPLKSTFMNSILPSSPVFLQMPLQGVLCVTKIAQVAAMKKRFGIIIYFKSIAQLQMLELALTQRPGSQFLKLKDRLKATLLWRKTMRRMMESTQKMRVLKEILAGGRRNLKVLWESSQMIKSFSCKKMNDLWLKLRLNIVNSESLHLLFPLLQPQRGACSLFLLLPWRPTLLHLSLGKCRNLTLHRQRQLSPRSSHRQVPRKKLSSRSFRREDLIIW